MTDQIKHKELRRVQFRVENTSFRIYEALGSILVPDKSTKLSIKDTS